MHLSILCLGRRKKQNHSRFNLTHTFFTSHVMKNIRMLFFEQQTINWPQNYSHVLQPFLRRINATCCCWVVVKSLGSDCLAYPPRDRRSQKSDISHAPYMTTMTILRISIDDIFVERNSQSKNYLINFTFYPVHSVRHTCPFL